MINLGQDDYGILQEAFKGQDVYMYMKSLDQGWMLGTDKPKSIHWSEFCQIPWSSMTVGSSGKAVMCEEDFDHERILGDASVQTLQEIWNGDEYKRLRQDHFSLTPGTKCKDRCDMKIIGKWLNGE